MRAVAPPRGARAPRRAAVLALLAALAVAGAGCDLAYPEVVVTNRTAAHVLLKDPSYNGCRWMGVLAYGESTTAKRCLPGSDRVHAGKFDPVRWCQDQARAGTAAADCAAVVRADGTVDPSDPALASVVPTWFPYRTVTVHHAEYGEFRAFEVTLDDLEQDFDVPGPYGH